MNRTAISRMARCGRAAALAALLGLAVMPAPAADQARAEMLDRDGNSLGVIELEQTENGVLLTGSLENLPAGAHAFHIHQTGKCDAAGGFESAGGHLSGGREHGFRVGAGPHPGDMSNVHGGGMLDVETFNPLVSLADTPGDRAALLDNDGSALVIHDGADDYRSQPSGDAGSRIACGVIEAD